MTADTSAHRLTREEARRIAVRAQLLDAARPGDVVEVAEQLGAIKIDPTATITTAEHAVLWSRIGWAYEPGQLRKSVEQDRLLFEFDGHFHAASFCRHIWRGCAPACSVSARRPGWRRTTGSVATSSLGCGRRADARGPDPRHESGGPSRRGRLVRAQSGAAHARPARLPR
jgi:hypothetical protein